MLDLAKRDTSRQAFRLLFDPEDEGDIFLRNDGLFPN
jgi:hypothetical protein